MHVHAQVLWSNFVFFYFTAFTRGNPSLPRNQIILFSVHKLVFGMAAMSFLCYGILLFQCNLLRVLPLLVLKYASCLLPYINSVPYPYSNALFTTQDTYDMYLNMEILCRVSHISCPCQYQSMEILINSLHPNNAIQLTLYKKNLRT